MEDCSLGVYEKSMPDTLSISEKLAAAKEAGFDFMELSVDETDRKLKRLDWTSSERWDLLNAMKKEGLPIRSMCLSGHRRFPLGSRDPQIRAESLSIMKKAIGLASDLGIRIIQIAGYDVYYEKSASDTEELFAENLNRSVETASREGVILAIETMEVPFLDTVRKGMHWVNTIDSPYLQMYPDTGNITNAAEGNTDAVLSDLESGRGHIAALHLKESRPGIYREVPYGEGHVDFAAVTEKTYDMGVRRYLAEFWFNGKENWKAVMKENNQFLRDQMRSELL